MYEALEKSTTFATSDLISFDKKIDKIEKYLNELIATKQPKSSGGKIIFDVSKLSTGIEFENLERLKEKIDNTIRGLLIHDSVVSGLYRRGEFYKKPTLKWVKQWVESLPSILKKYKWSKTISFKDVFLKNNMPVGWYSKYEEIPYRCVFELNQIYETLDDEGKEALLNTIMKEISNFVTKPPEPNEPNEQNEPDDIPF